MTTACKAIGAMFALALLGSHPAAAQQTDGRIAVSQPWARATPGGAKIGVAYVELSAPKEASDKLVSAKSPAAGAVELHTHANEGGVMKMRRVESIPVEAGKKITMQPGGLHMMLMDLQQPLREGETFDLTLVFENAGEVTLKVPVLKVGSPGPGGKTVPGGGHGHQGGHGKH